jgi:saccharopine dehydrogenase-like NADP-dependent oxidoreductase
MTTVLLLGLGLQGKAVIHDLARSDRLSAIVVAEMDSGAAGEYLQAKGYARSRAVPLNASDEGQLKGLLASVKPSITLCMLPADFNYAVAQAAIEAGSHFVSSSYAGRVVELDTQARERGVTVLPEMGMDPGIDLVLAQLALAELDEVHGLYSYGTGLPEPRLRGDNPLHYKITWTFDGVLKSYKRPARLLERGREVLIPGNEIFKEEHGHTVEIPGLGPLEAYPNGDAIHYIEAFKLGGAVRDMGRFALRYPGHRRFWLQMAALGFLDDTPLSVGGAAISPRQFLVHHLTPRLQFAADQRDVIALRVTAWGRKGGRGLKATYQLIDYRDLTTGLFAMNRTVGYTVSIGAQMILDGRIAGPGVLSPTRDVPASDLVRELKARGMTVTRSVEPCEEG